MIKVTQVQVAERLGLSRRAVGFALSDDPHSQRQVCPETRQRVMAAARQLGYRPHRHAQLMRGKKSGLIGMIKTTGIIQTAVERAYFAAHAVQEAGYGLVVNEIHWDEAQVRRAANVMMDAQVEGVILAGLASLDEATVAELQRLRAAGIPMVAIGGVRPLSIPFVTTDYRQGMAELTNHVVSLGHRALVMVSAIRPEEASPTRHLGFTARLDGFREAAEAAGLNPAQARVLAPTVAGDWMDDYAPGEAAVRSLIASGERPDALLCSNDDWAVGALAACTDAGWKVPDDISITGFDDATVGRYTRPSLTTVAQPTEAVAKRSVELLMKQMRGQTISDGEAVVKLPCRLVVRHSTGPARNR